MWGRGRVPEGWNGIGKSLQNMGGGEAPSDFSPSELSAEELTRFAVEYSTDKLEY